MAQDDQFFNNGRNDGLGSTVGLRWNTDPWRCDLSDFHTIVLSCWLSLGVLGWTQQSTERAILAAASLRAIDRPWRTPARLGCTADTGHAVLAILRAMNSGKASAALAPRSTLMP